MSNNFEAEILHIKAGEPYKNINTLSEIYDKAFEIGFDRNLTFGFI